MTEAKRPNILFIISDEQRADCYGFAGRNVKTPHLDQLVQQGTYFNACITPNVVCQSTRTSIILTGQLPRTHGVHDNGIDISQTWHSALPTSWHNSRMCCLRGLGCRWIWRRCALICIS